MNGPGASDEGGADDRQGADEAALACGFGLRRRDHPGERSV
jgi:hypothetical protein